MHIATITTRHFSFMAAGLTDEEARRTLMKGWKRHCSLVRRWGGSVDPNHIGSDDIRVDELEPGQCLRDSDLILNSPKPKPVKHKCDNCGKLTSEEPMQTRLGLVDGPRWCADCKEKHCDPPFEMPESLRS